MHSLYIITTELCQMNCPFCYTKFADGFNVDKNGTYLFTDEEPDINSDLAAKVINKGFVAPSGKVEPFDYVIFHGGEPLLFPETIMEIMDKVNVKVKYSIQTNLAYKDLSKEQIKLLIRLGSYGTSYSVDRFMNNQTAERQVINNVKYLETMGVYGTLLVTVTIDQYLRQSPEELYKYIKQHYTGIRYVLFERPIYPIKDINEDRYRFEKIYSKVDSYLVQALDVFPKDMIDIYDKFKDAITYKRPFYPIHCSKQDCTLYKDQIKYGCPSKELIDGKPIDDSEKINKECLYCKYYPYCGGDCECMNHVCAFPKRTFNKVREEVMKSNDKR